MKKAITTIVTAVLMTLSFSSFASSTTNPLKVKDAKEILLTYVEAISIGSTDFNKFLFADDFQYENSANSTNKKYGKKDYLQFLKQNKGTVYNCETKSQILDQTGNTAVAKTILKFENFTRVDHITLTQTKEGWKISKVISSYL